MPSFKDLSVKMVKGAIAQQNPNDYFAQVDAMDKGVAQGIRAGSAKAGTIYGTDTLGNLGTDISDVVKRRKDALNQEGPAASRQMEERNRRIRRARQMYGNLTPEMERQIDRESSMDIEDTRYGQEQNNLAQYQKLLGNIAANSSALEMGYAGLQKAGDYTPPPSYGSSGLTVICTELMRQGLLPQEYWAADRLYGLRMIEKCPEIYLGYRFMATPIAKLMRKHKWVTNIVKVPAIKWAKHIAQEKNIIGYLINTLGCPLCFLVGCFLLGGKYGQLPKEN